MRKILINSVVENSCKINQKKRVKNWDAVKYTYCIQINIINCAGIQSSIGPVTPTGWSRCHQATLSEWRLLSTSIYRSIFLICCRQEFTNQDQISWFSWNVPCILHVTKDFGHCPVQKCQTTSRVSKHFDSSFFSTTWQGVASNWMVSRMSQKHRWIGGLDLVKPITL